MQMPLRDYEQGLVDLVDDVEGRGLDLGQLMF